MSLRRNILLVFTGITIISILLTFAAQYLLLSDELYFNSLSEQLTFDEINNLVEQSRQSSWLIYVILPFLNLIKFSFVTSCLSLGYYFLTNKWIFGSFFYIVTRAELIQLLPILIKLFWFLFFQTNYDFNDIQTFYPLSLLNLFSVQSVSPYLAYPLQLANLFELTYWLVLAYGVSQVIEFPMPRAFGLVAASYGSGLLVWVVFIMFLTVSLS